MGCLVKLLAISSVMSQREPEGDSEHQKQAIEYIQSKLSTISTNDEVDELDSMLNALTI
jgi:hypothetical protein